MICNDKNNIVRNGCVYIYCYIYTKKKNMNSNNKIRVSKIWSRGHLENLPAHPSDGTSPHGDSSVNKPLKITMLRGKCPVPGEIPRGYIFDQHRLGTWSVREYNQISRSWQWQLSCQKQRGTSFGCFNRKRKIQTKTIAVAFAIKQMWNFMTFPSSSPHTPPGRPPSRLPPCPVSLWGKGTDKCRRQRCKSWTKRAVYWNLKQ